MKEGGLGVYTRPKMVALLLLGFSSGLPLYLTRDTLQAWMSGSGVSLAAIGAFSLVGLPYSLKFLWAPLVDRFAPPFLGRRRGWMVLTQVALVLAIGAMALQDPSGALQWLAINALVIACLSATQDIAFDAYRTDVLEEHELGAGAAIGVLGYRVALLLTGSAALVLADRVSWPVVYLVMALLMGIGILTSLRAPEPSAQAALLPQTLTDAVKLPFAEFFGRSGLRRGVFILVFIVLYKLGDSLAAVMSTPFLLEAGFTQTDIGAIKGGLGLAATIVGVLVGGAILGRLGVYRSLWIFGGLQAVSNLAYFGLALAGSNYPFMITTISIENFCAGLGTAAFVAFLMSLCNPSFSATQYALLSSLMALSSTIVVSPAGLLAQATGWPWFFLITLVVALPGLLLLPWFAPWNARSTTG